MSKSLSLQHTIYVSIEFPSFFSTKFSKLSVYCTYIQSSSVWTGHISSAQQPHVPSGYRTGQHGCKSEKEVLPSPLISLSPELKTEMSASLYPEKRSKSSEQFWSKLLV